MKEYETAMKKQQEEERNIDEEIAKLEAAKKAKESAWVLYQLKTNYSEDFLLNLEAAKATPKPETTGIENTSFVRESPSRMSRASNGQNLRASAHGSTRASGRSVSTIPDPKPRSSPPEKLAKMEIDENLNRQFC